MTIQNQNAIINRNLKTVQPNKQKRVNGKVKPKGPSVVKSQYSNHESVQKIHLEQVLLHVRAKLDIEKFSSLDPGLQERFIPYLLPKFMKKTQIVEIRLPITATKITLANGVSYTTTYSVSAGALNNFTDCANLFDEYRVVRGELRYHATYANTANNIAWGGAAIDYGVSAAFGSFDAMYSHDQAVIGSYTNYNAKDVGKARFRWPLQFEPMPDQDWIPTTTSNTVFAYWKPYLLGATINASEDAGHLLGYVDVQFRGMSA
jgi:hypothetical protein